MFPAFRAVVIPTDTSCDSRVEHISRPQHLIELPRTIDRHQHIRL